ncbi:MAG: hypothetical protein AMJ95_11655 [Omnitrophica WOR_2 bacterium SM23_72]|nr:MAG: hypothetical protein AMJ95_11655 [Omnitrophica WOR_2 bacterium SM23_72]
MKQILQKNPTSMRVSISDALDAAGGAFAIEIIRALQFWHSEPQIIIQLCTGESPFIGYRKIGGDKYLEEKGMYNPGEKFESILDSWGKPKTQALLKKNGLDTRLKPEMSKVIAFAIDTIFPQRGSDYFAFANLLNNVCNLWGIPNQNRHLFCGDIRVTKEGGQWKINRIPEKEYKEIIDSINGEGLRILEYQAGCMIGNDKGGFALNSSLRLDNGKIFGKRLKRDKQGDFHVAEIEIKALKSEHIQYRYLEGMRNQALMMNEKIIRLGGAHITLLGVGPSYEGEGHIGFCERDTPEEQTCFMGAINDYDATFHISGTHAKEFQGFKNMFITLDNIRVPKLGFITYGPRELMYRQRETKSSDIIVIATGNLKSSSVARAIKGCRDTRYPLSLTQNCRGIYVLDNTSARQLYVQRAQERKGKAREFAPSFIRPAQINDKLKAWSVKQSADVLLINPHMDDDFLGMMHLLKEISPNYKIHACYASFGYTAVYSDYILGLLEIAGSLNWTRPDNPNLQPKQELLKELIKERGFRRRIPHLDYEILPHMSQKERELRAMILLIDLNEGFGSFKNKADIAGLKGFLTEVEQRKAQGGCVDIDIMRFLKTSVRFAEAASALMYLGIDYKNIHWPFEVSFYGTLGRPLAIKQGDIDKIKEMIKTISPKVVIFNGEGFPDFGAHSNTEMGTYIALFELKKQGLIGDVLLIQWAGVWDRIELAASGLSVILTSQELQDFYNAFNYFYPSQAPYAPVPNASSCLPQSFAQDVIVNARQSAKELLSLRNLPPDVEKMLKQEAGVLNYKVARLSDEQLWSEFQRKSKELMRSRLSIDISSNTALIGPEPYPERLEELSSTLVAEMFSKGAISGRERDLFGYRASFYLTVEEMAGIVDSFHKEMKRGLGAEESSLAMLPTFIGGLTDREKGVFLALDLGGSTLRVLAVHLPGGGGSPRAIIEKYSLKATDEERRRGIDYDYTRVSADRLFTAIVRYIQLFLEKHQKRIIKYGYKKPYNLGFTFSFAITKLAIDQAVVNSLSKEFDIPNIINKDAVLLLRRAISRAGLDNTVRVVSLNNDTVATLIARRYQDKDCDVGGILGTGTNFCYMELLENIHKLTDEQRGRFNKQAMIINIESGNFNKIAQNSYDKILDEQSMNKGVHITEKMVSGLYLGEITRLILFDYINKGFLFNGGLTAQEMNRVSERGGFQSPFITKIAQDNSRSLKNVHAQLIEWGIENEHIGLEDKAIIKDICKAVSRRAARITAAVVFAIVTHIDEYIERHHTVAIDGSIFEKHLDFKKDMQEAIKQLSWEVVKQDRSNGISLELTTGGSGLGAAIIAAGAA